MRAHRFFLSTPLSIPNLPTLLTTLDKTLSDFNSY